MSSKKLYRIRQSLLFHVQGRRKKILLIAKVIWRNFSAGWWNNRRYYLNKLKKISYWEKKTIKFFLRDDSGEEMRKFILYVSFDPLLNFYIFRNRGKRWESHYNKHITKIFFFQCKEERDTKCIFFEFQIRSICFLRHLSSTSIICIIIVLDKAHTEATLYWIAKQTKSNLNHSLISHGSEKYQIALLAKCRIDWG